MLNGTVLVSQMLDLAKGARPDERFHLQMALPIARSCVGWRWLLRRTAWTNIVLPDGRPARFVTWVLCWGLQLYHGTAKCDGSRTFMLRHGQLGGTAHERSGFVMTTTPAELLAFRWRWKGLDKEPTWQNMGGS